MTIERIFTCTGPGSPQTEHTSVRIVAGAGIQGDRYGLSIFANNVTNKRYLNEVITAVEFGGSFITPGTRRLIGVEGSYKF